MDHKTSKLREFVSHQKRKIVCLQEWAIHHNECRIFPQEILSDFVVHAANHKTAILWNKHLTGIAAINSIDLDPALLHFWSVVSIVTQSQTPVILISYYRAFKGRINPVLQFADLFRKIKKLRTEFGPTALFLINGDFNAKHTHWNSTKIDPAGVELLNHCLTSETALRVINDGSPTHYSHCNHYLPEVLDLTITEPTLIPLIRHWKSWHRRQIDWIPSHCCITYDLQINIKFAYIKPGPRWNWNAADWDLFRLLLAKELATLSTELDRPGLTTSDLDSLTERFNSVFLSVQAQAVPITYDHLEFSLATDAKFQHFQKQKKQMLKNTKKYKNKHSKKWNAVAVHTKRTLNRCRKQTKRRKKKLIRSHNQRKSIEIMNDAIEYDDNNTQRIFWYHWNAMKHKKASFQAPLKLENNQWIVDPAAQIQLFENEFHTKFTIVNPCNYQLVLNDSNLYLSDTRDSNSTSLPPTSSCTITNHNARPT